MTTNLKPKREPGTRQFILINEENLIKEVRKRPILYNKSLKGYRKPSTREQSWREVAYALNCTRKFKIFQLYCCNLSTFTCHIREKLFYFEFLPDAEGLIDPLGILGAGLCIYIFRL